MYLLWKVMCNVYLIFKILNGTLYHLYLDSEMNSIARFELHILWDVIPSVVMKYLSRHHGAQSWTQISSNVFISVASVRMLPHLTAQCFELTLELFVGLLLLLQVSLLFLLVVFQSVDLLLRLIHLPLQSLQTQVQLHTHTHTHSKKQYWLHIHHNSTLLQSVATYLKGPNRYYFQVMSFSCPLRGGCLLTWSFWSCSEWCSSSTCIIISFTLRSSRRFASCRLPRSLLNI